MKQKNTLVFWYKSKCVCLYDSGLFNAWLSDSFGYFIVYQLKIISLLTYKIYNNSTPVSVPQFMFNRNTNICVNSLLSNACILAKFFSSWYESSALTCEWADPERHSYYHRFSHLQDTVTIETWVPPSSWQPQSRLMHGFNLLTDAELEQTYRKEEKTQMRSH